MASNTLHGEFSSSDASGLTETNSRFTLYGPASASALTLGSTDYVCITDLVFTAGSALTITIYDGANNSVAGGEKAAYVQLGAGATGHLRLVSPFVCQVGTYPKVKTNTSGQVDVILLGDIYRSV